MRNLLSVVLLTVLSIVAHAQSLRIYYSKTHKTALNPVKTDQEDMILLIKPNETSYLSYEKIRQRVSKVRELQYLRTQSTETMPTLSADPGRTVTCAEMVRKPGEDKATVIDFLGQYYAYTDNLEKIQWNIEKEIREEHGYPVKKATGVFRGRTWTAWFSEDIPVPAGPWLLGGLPGLIVHAYDENKEIEFRMTAIEDEKIEDEVLTENDKVLKETGTLNRKISNVSKQEFFRLRKTMAKDPKAFRKTIYSQAMSVQDYGILNDNSWLIVPANPIDKKESTY